jgi:hypothetical protein
MWPNMPSRARSRATSTKMFVITATNRNQHDRIVPHPVEIEGILLQAAAETPAITISNIVRGYRRGSR